LPQKHFIKLLFRKYLDNQCSPEEVETLFMLLDKEENKLIKEELIYAQLQARNPGMALADPELHEKLNQNLVQVMSAIGQPKEKGSILRLGNYWKWAAAAVVLGAMAIGVYNLASRHISPEVAIIKTTPSVKDIPAPSLVKATLRLADGREVNLDNAQNGSLAVQGEVKIIKTADGRITYVGKGNETLYNSLINPRGSKVVAISLADGTRVWLNAETTLRYPTAFTGNDRRVEISGEAYFEVAHDASKPFYVTKGGMEVKVLGTHFNVNTYEDGEPAKVTLLEGSVKVVNDGKPLMLTPGQQARMDGFNMRVLDNVDMDEVMAWKNGKFQFGENTGIETIMNQVARWYNVQVEYKGAISQHFWGTVSRDVNVSQVLHKLESTGGVKFKIEGNKVLVMP
jgi:transmembrane sensor